MKPLLVDDYRGLYYRMILGIGRIQEGNPYQWMITHDGWMLHCHVWSRNKMVNISESEQMRLIPRKQGEGTCGIWSGSSGIQEFRDTCLHNLHNQKEVSLCLKMEKWQPLYSHIDKENGSLLDELGYRTLFSDRFVQRWFFWLSPCLQSLLGVFVQRKPC